MMQGSSLKPVTIVMSYDKQAPCRSEAIETVQTQTYSHYEMVVDDVT